LPVLNSCNLLNIEDECFIEVIVLASFDFVENFGPVGVRKAKDTAAHCLKPILAYQFEPIDQVPLVRGPTGHFDNFLAFLCVIGFAHINSKSFLIVEIKKK